jgi:hypothetical protein
MKVIFLDIDGVMNSQVFYEQRQNKKKYTWRYVIRKYLVRLGILKPITSQNWTPPKNMYTFEYQYKRLVEETCPQKWEWLSTFCNETDTKICVSSVWKNHFGDKEGRIPEWWADALTRLGFKEGTFVGITTTRRTLRGQEIQEWLDNHPEVEDYAILDDDSDMMEHQFSQFHHCDGYFGMSPNHLYRIGRQFENKSNYERLTKSL